MATVRDDACCRKHLLGGLPEIGELAAPGVDALHVDDRRVRLGQRGLDELGDVRGELGEGVRGVAGQSRVLGLEQLRPHGGVQLERELTVTDQFRIVVAVLLEALDDARLEVGQPGLLGEPREAVQGQGEGPVTVAVRGQLAPQAAGPPRVGQEVSEDLLLSRCGHDDLLDDGVGVRLSPLGEAADLGVTPSLRGIWSMGRGS
jgi:hypothetical protein